MKKVYIIFAAFLIVAGCTSSRKHLERGNYDAAINKSVKKLMKKPDKIEELNILKKAYTMANNRDNDRLNTLKFSGQPDIWTEVFYLYDNLSARQEVVERLPDNLLMKIGHEHVDYNKAKAEAKNKAAEYYYNHASSLLDNNNRQDARKAYSELLTLQKFYPNYPNLRKLMDDAILIGTNNVLFKMRNDSRTVMPQDFETEILKITLKNLNQQWLNFDVREDKKLYYDYHIYLTIKTIDVSPEREKEINYEEKKLVRDGDKYVLDANGNVKKDSLGRDIKEPNYVNITCQVVETRLEKTTTVGGTIDFFDNRTGQLIKTFPINATKTFLYRYAKAYGNTNALKDETKKIIGLNPIPFPTNLQMIYDTNEDLKKVTVDIVAANKSMLIN